MTFQEDFSYLALVKQKIASALLLSQWVFGLWLLIFFPPQAHAKQQFSHQTTLEVGDHFTVDHGILPESQEVEADPRLFLSTQSGAEKLPFTVPFLCFCLNPLYLDSVPLFDIKSTFIHFFYTW